MVLLEFLEKFDFIDYGIMTLDKPDNLVIRINYGFHYFEFGLAAMYGQDKTDYLHKILSPKLLKTKISSIDLRTEKSEGYDPYTCLNVWLVE